MRGLLSKTTKRAWRTAVACALASCGLARAEDDAQPLAAASAATPATPAPPDLSAIYRDAYLNPNVVAPPGASSDRALAGVWTNPKRWKVYFGGDYIRWQRSGVPQLALTTVSRNLFWDDPDQQALGALNPEGQPSREGGLNPPVALFPAKVFPDAQLPLERYNPNDPEVRFNVNEFLEPGAVRLSTDDFDVTRVRSGFRPKIGVQFENGDRVDVSYFVIEDVQPASIVDNVTESAFLVKQISSARINPFGLPFERPLDAAGGARFGMFRWGYINAPFQITQGSRELNLFLQFRGEDVRAFAPPPPGNLFPHFPYNEIPQPTVNPGPFDPITNPLLPLHSQVDQNGIRSSDIPREPTSNDFPGQSFLFQDGELAVATFRSDIQGVEAVYRRQLREWTRSWFDLDLLVALKYVNMNERFTFFFADLWNFSRTTAAGVPFPNGGVTETPNVPQPPFFVPNDFGLVDPPDQRGQAGEDTQITIDRRVANNLFGPQIGFDWRVPFWSTFDAQVATKVGFVFNGMSTSALTFRGDGLIYSDYTKSVMKTSCIWDGRLGLNYAPHPRVNLNGGFEWLLLSSVGGAVTNQALDLSDENRPRNRDDLLYTGWYVGGEFKY